MSIEEKNTGQHKLYVFLALLLFIPGRGVFAPCEEGELA